MKTLIPTFLLVTVLAAPGLAQDDRRPAAVFNNYKIYVEDLQVGADLAARKQAELTPVKYEQFEYTYRMEILARKIHALLLKRILNENRYEVTDSELNAYLQHTRRLRSKLTEAELNRIRSDIMNWHFDSILYQKYGGRAVRMPTGRIKPVEAYYELVEEMLAQRVLYFPDISYRAALKILEAYFERDKHPPAGELEAEKYFLQPTWGPFNERYNALPDADKYRIKSRMKMLRMMEKRSQSTP